MCEGRWHTPRDLWWLLLVPCCCALDLNLIRHNTVAPPPEQDSFYHYVAPLAPDSAFLPLCGNGVVNSAQDYDAYYAGGGADFHFARENSMVQILASETCDDGNRLDGDGCSADCMTMDSFVNACEVESAEPPPAIVDTTVDAVTGDMYVVAPAGVYRVVTDPLRMGVVYNVVALVSGASSVSQAFSGSMYLFARSTGTVYLLQHAAVSVHMQSACTTAETGYFFAYAGVMRLVVKTGTVLCHIDLEIKRETCFTLGALPPVLANRYLLFPTMKTLTITLEGDRQITLALDPVQASVEASRMANPLVTGDLWMDLQNYGVVPGLSLLPFMQDVTVRSRATGAIPRLTMAYRSGMSIYGATLMSTTSSSIRGMTMAADAHPGGPSLGYRELMLMLRGVRRATYCSADAPCVMDMPVEYDLFDPGSDPNAKPSLMDVAAELVSGRVLEPSTNNSAYASFLGNLSAMVLSRVATKVMQRMETHPVSGAWVILQRGRLLYVSRRGVSVRTTGNRCLPVDVGLCAPCTWAEAAGQCQPCSVVAQDSVAWHVQCGVKCANQRRLLAEAPSFVEVVVRGATETEIRAVFPDADVSAQRGGVCARFSNTTDAAALMRTVREAIYTHASWQVLVEPVVVYPTDRAVERAAAEATLGTGLIILIAVLAAVMGVGLLLMVFVICKRGRAAQPAAAAPELEMPRIDRVHAA
jgi:cysteine-rich repeat protein